MSGQPPPPPPPPERDGGPHLQSGGDVTVGGDVAGRDVIKQQTTITGFSEKTVVRLMLVVGALVFVTAGCFFSGGIVVGAAALGALNRPVSSAPEKGVVFEQKLTALSGAPAGQTVALRFSEAEISSYVKYILGPEIGFMPETGKVRLVDNQQVVVSGQMADLGGLEVAATFQLSNLPGQPLALQGAAAHLLPLGDSAFGWTALPAGLLQPAADQLNARLSNVQLVDAAVVSLVPEQMEWELTLVTR